MTRTGARANIEIVMTWLDAMRRKDLDAAIALFAPDVVWEGLVPGVECSNRGAVSAMLDESLNDDIEVEQLDLIAGNDHAVLGIRSRQLEELAGVKLNGQLFNVLTIHDGRIVRVRDFALRSEAHTAAGLHDPGWH
jgi:ketosteroid isomerase-like protein